MCQAFSITSFRLEPKQLKGLGLQVSELRLWARAGLVLCCGDGLAIGPSLLEPSLLNFSKVPSSKYYQETW